MKIICAWCEREGKPGYLGEREPLDNPQVTHGICGAHLEQLLASFPSRSFPDAELLIIVHHNDTALYDYLQRRFAGVRGVRVIMDRRRAERRREPPLVPDDRRSHSRRIRQGTVSLLGYTAVRFRRRIEPPHGSPPDTVQL